MLYSWLFPLCLDLVFVNIVPVAQYMYLFDKQITLFYKTYLYTGNVLKMGGSELVMVLLENL